MALKLKLVCLAASVGASAGLLIYYFVSKEKNEKEVVVTAEEIYEYNGIDKVAIDVGGTDAILSKTAEEKLRKLLNEKNEKEVVVTAEEIYEYNGIDNVAIDVGGTDAILSKTAEEKLRKLLNEREKSSLLYM